MYLIYGLQKSGISIIELFEKKRIEYKLWDDNSKVRNILGKKYSKNIFFNPKINDLNIFKKIFLSPGISLRKKQFKHLNKINKLQRDLNLYTSYLTKEKIIAITGTNGKSTTTKLIGDILKKNKMKTFIGGNYGEPLCKSITLNKKFDYHVIELSSFQLETIKNINTKISIITNLSNDHLDRYYNITDYIKQKKNIISKNGVNLISIDDKYSKKIFQTTRNKKFISFSIYNKSANLYMGENFILDNYFKKNKKIFISEISSDLEGSFNNQNILIAYICVKLLKLPEKIFLDVIKKFKGLPYRASIIFNSNKLKIINNSKSTNINSTINSIKNYNNIYLILGGRAKEKNFEILSNFKEKIICTYVFGQSASFIEKKINKFLNVKKFKNLKTLVMQIMKDIKKKDAKLTILFAPACSSYDQYNNYMERGSEFSKLIKKHITDNEIS